MPALGARVPGLALAALLLALVLFPPRFSAAGTNRAMTVAAVAGVCGDPAALVAGEQGPQPKVVTAADALLVLRVAVALATCDPCVCDVNNSGGVTAGDALRVLAFAVGQPVVLDCPICVPVSTTSTTLCADVFEDGLSFGVTEDSGGVPDSAVAAEAAVSEHPADLFSSTGAGAHAPGAAGDNTLALEDVDLGLAPGDELDAISFGPFAGDAPAVHFSLRNSPRVMGVDGSDVRAQSDGEVVPGDVYSSDGRPAPVRATNTILLDEIGLGLQPHDLTSDPTDDLDALDFSALGDPYYLSVARESGLGGARILRSAGGQAAQILSAADLGLLDGDEIDALVVQDVDGDGQFGAGDYVLFSVSLDSLGTPGSDVRAQARLGEAAGDVYLSSGGGSHSLAMDEGDLGLLPADDVDALELRAHTVVCEGPFCGDGVLQAAEQCEVGIPCANPNDICLFPFFGCACYSGFCEDGILTPPEQCEPGRIPCPPGQFCTPDCKCVKLATCPNGVLDPGEQCENGIACADPGDACNLANCQCIDDAYCDNGQLDPGEQCDPPGADCPQGQVCNLGTCQCVPEGAFECPDGNLDPGEQCEAGIACPEGQHCIVQECACVELACVPDGEVGAGEACDPLANPNGCEFDGLSCNQRCECAQYTPRCNDEFFTPGDEDCDRVRIGSGFVEVGCDPGQRCSPEGCVCASCIDPDPKAIGVIEHQGFKIPACQLHIAPPDVCTEDHWHGQGWGFDTTGTVFQFFNDPNPGACGYGAVSAVPAVSFQLGGQLACELLERDVSCIQQ
jgi:hypothetical protein